MTLDDWMQHMFYFTSAANITRLLEVYKREDKLNEKRRHEGKHSSLNFNGPLALERFSSGRVDLELTVLSYRWEFDRNYWAMPEPTQKLYEFKLNFLMYL